MLRFNGQLLYTNYVTELSVGAIFDTRLSGSGLPDFSWYNIPKREQIHSTNYHIIYLNGSKYYLPKIYPNWDFWFEKYTSWQPWLG
jgi:hypothetical protein